MRKNWKLTDEEVRLIRWLVGVNQYELAKHFGVTQGRISDIQSGKKIRANAREKELDRFSDKKTRTIASRLRRAARAKDSSQEAGSSGKKRRQDWATRKTSQDFERTLAQRRSNPNWVRSIEKFKEYHKRPDALYHAKLNGLKTHCKRRHPLKGDNVYVQVYKGRVMRRCVTCFNQYQKERNAKKNAIRKAHGARRCREQIEA